MKIQTFVIALAAYCVTSTANAQSDKAPAPDCPAQYELIGGTLCMKASNGDIVLPTERAVAVRFTNANCPAGYEILFDNQCMSAKTGDIVFATETPGNTIAKK